MKVNDVMLSLNNFPVVKQELFFKEALDVMNEKKLGIACVVDQDYVLKGILTDGDIRRKLLRVQKSLSALFVDDCIDHAILSPKTIDINDSLELAVNLMGEKRVWDLPVVENGILKGLLHLHPLVDALLKAR